MPIIRDLEQQSPDWLKMRLGMATASRVADAQSFLTRKSVNGQKGDPSGDRINYKHELVIEQLTGLTPVNFVTPAMQWGIDNESLAREAYEIERDIETELIGFAIHDAIPRFGASPDALVPPDGLLEIKCPTTAVHLDYLLAGVVPEQYKPQMLAEMACTNRQWVDFVSFDPRLKGPFKHLRLFIRRFHRDEKVIGEMEQSVEKFLAEVDEMLERLKQDDPSSLVGALARSVEAVGQGLAG